MPRRSFNTTGPCVPGKHYMLDPLRGISNELMDLIRNEQYFVIHAARQTGKTTLLLELADRINAKGDYYVLYCTLEAMQDMIDPAIGIPRIVSKINARINKQGLPEGFAKDLDYNDFSDVINAAFTNYCQTLDKPLVVFFDEADCLSNGTLITFLRQLREGYITRGREPFVHSVALVGMRNIRDYRARIREDSETLGSSSPFNIMVESIMLRNFTKEEVVELYTQHTAETGQAFTPEAVEHAFEQTQGQPWLVNAIARECVEKITKKNYSMPITVQMAEQAIQDLILARGTHFDSLLERLKERRVRNVIVPLLLGGEVVDKRSNDYLFTRDLGLIRELDGNTVPANPIYAEEIVRSLNYIVQDSIADAHKEYTIPRYLKGGKIDMDFLLVDFQEYWRENSEIWVKLYETDFYQYDEAAPHLVLQAFLQRVVNGGGQVLREMALGTRRADLCVVYDGQKYPIELKILRNAKTRPEGVRQLLAYMDSVGSDTGWLVIFDRSAEKTWDEKVYMEKERVDGKEITVVGC